MSGRKELVTFPLHLTRFRQVLPLAHGRMNMSLGCTCLRAFAIAAALVCLAAPGGARAASRPQTATRPTATVVSTIRGIVWNPDNSPYPNGKVRLRNLHTGRVEATDVTTERGQFTFDRIPRGSYLTEVVDEAGKVIAVGQSFTVEGGESRRHVRPAAGAPVMAGRGLLQHRGRRHCCRVQRRGNSHRLEVTAGQPAVSQPPRDV